GDDERGHPRVRGHRSGPRGADVLGVGDRTAAGAVGDDEGPANDPGGGDGGRGRVHGGEAARLHVAAGGRAAPASGEGIAMSVVAVPAAGVRGARTGRRRWQVSWAVGVCLLVVAGVVVMALLGPRIAPYDPQGQDLAIELSPPNAAHWLGTD